MSNNNVKTPQEVNGKDYILEVNGLKQHFPTEKNFMGKPIGFLKADPSVTS